MSANDQWQTVNRKTKTNKNTGASQSEIKNTKQPADTSSFQQWEEVKWTARAKAAPVKKGEAAVSQNPSALNSVVKEKTGIQNSASIRSAANADDDNDGDYHIDRVSLNFARSLQKARMEKNLTQTELAQKINEKAVVINQYESGKAIPNGAVIQKLQRVLGTKLPKPNK